MTIRNTGGRRQRGQRRMPGHDLANRLTLMEPGHGAGTPSYAYGYGGQAVVQANVLSGTSWVPFSNDEERARAIANRQRADVGLQPIDPRAFR